MRPATYLSLLVILLPSASCGTKQTRSPEQELSPSASRGVEEILGRLKTGTNEDGSGALRDLIALGTPALPALRNHLQGGERGVRELVLHAIAEIERQDRLAVIIPRGRRMTIDVANLPAEEAATRIFEPFDLHVQVGDAPLKGKPCSLQIKDATLWKALDAFCEACGAESPIGGRDRWRAWSFQAKGANPTWRTADVGEGRLVASVGTFTQGPNREGVWLRLKILMPPDHLPIDARVESLVVTGNGGTKVNGNVDREDRRDPRLYRNPHGVSSMEAAWMEFERADLARTNLLRAEGTLVVSYPHDVEIKRAELRYWWSGLDQSFPGGVVRVSGFNPIPGGCEVSLKGEASGAEDPALYLVWAEDEAGRRLFDFGSPARLEKLNGYFHISLGEGSPSPERLVVARLIGSDPVRLPFTIQEIPVPEVRKK